MAYTRSAIWLACRRKPRSGTNFENAVAGLYPRRLDHQGDDVGLRNRLTLADWEWAVLVGKFLKISFDKGFARHLSHGVENKAVAYAATCDLNIDHAVADAGRIKHQKSTARLGLGRTSTSL
jgi:hypothetical protein